MYCKTQSLIFSIVSLGNQTAVYDCSHGYLNYPDVLWLLNITVCMQEIGYKVSTSLLIPEVQNDIIRDLIIS